MVSLCRAFSLGRKPSSPVLKVGITPLFLPLISHINLPEVATALFTRSKGLANPSYY